MNAHERREALMGWLRGRVSGTAAEAGGHFGVTERTILRDIDFLRSRGEPISSSSGPGGGFQLDGMARLPAVRLTVEEVLGLGFELGVEFRFVCRQARPVQKRQGTAQDAHKEHRVEQSVAKDEATASHFPPGDIPHRAPCEAEVGRNSHRFSVATD